MSQDGVILLVGAGRMGGALLEGWLTKGMRASSVVVEEPQPSANLTRFIAEHGIRQGLASLQEMPAAAVLAVKPQIMDSVLPSVAKVCGPQTVIISIAAGRTIAGIEKYFAPGAAVIRTMPNTPAAIGRGITVAVGNSAVTEEHLALCDRLLGAVGEVVWIADEALMDAVTAVSGSGPAYVFLLAECLAEAGRQAGLDADLAARLACATVTGAGELLHRSGAAPDVLRQNVTSPGGTTAAALSVLMGEGGLKELMIRAVDAATKRSRELSG